MPIIGVKKTLLYYTSLDKKYKYVMGMNESADGYLYCFDFPKYFNDNIDVFIDVQVPEDANILRSTKKYIIVDKLILLQEINEQKLYDYVLNCGLYLKYIKKQTYKMCLDAVKQNGMSIQYIKNKTFDICLSAVEQDGLSLKYIPQKIKNSDLCCRAVNQNGLALEHVPGELKSEHICKIALKENGLALKFIEKQTDEMCTIAVEQNNLAILFIINMTPEIEKIAGEDPFIKKIIKKKAKQ